MQGMSELLRTLAQHYRLVLLSNVDKYYWRVATELPPELTLFERFVLSCEMGMAKPDVRVFEYVLELADVKPDQCFFIDDKAENIDAHRR
jgi:putative hydrolase of the HAD superfamily